MSPAAVILAAGAGRRLGEVGRRHSKAMLPVAGLPLIEWVVERLRAAGIERFVVVGHVSDEPLAAFLRAHHPKASYLRQSERRGIADALRLALPSLAPDESYLACACDSLFEADDIAGLLTLAQQHRGAAVVGVLEMGIEAASSRSAVRIEAERVVEIVEKPRPGSIATGLVSMPLYWLPPAFTRHLEVPPASGEHYVSTALAAFVAAGGTLLPFHVRHRLEITTAADIAPVEKSLLEL